MKVDFAMSESTIIELFILIFLIQLGIGFLVMYLMKGEVKRLKNSLRLHLNDSENEFANKDKDSGDKNRKNDLNDQC